MWTFSFWTAACQTFSVLTFVHWRLGCQYLNSSQMTCEGFSHQPGGCSPVKLLGFTCLNEQQWFSFILRARVFQVIGKKIGENAHFAISVITLPLLTGIQTHSSQTLLCLADTTFKTVRKQTTLLWSVYQSIFWQTLLDL